MKLIGLSRTPLEVRNWSRSSGQKENLLGRCQRPLPSRTSQDLSRMKETEEFLARYCKNWHLRESKRKTLKSSWQRGCIDPVLTKRRWKCLGKRSLTDIRYLTTIAR